LIKVFAKAGHWTGLGTGLPGAWTGLDWTWSNQDGADQETVYSIRDRVIKSQL